MLFAGVSQLLVTKGSAKLVMAFGMTVIGVGILWTTQAPVHGHYWANLFGPFLVAVGMGSAFAFIPVSIAALAGVAEHKAGVASGLIYTSQELGGALGIAIASSIAASQYNTLLRGGNSVDAALTGGFHSALWVSGDRTPRDPSHVPADPQGGDGSSRRNRPPKSTTRACHLTRSLDNHHPKRRTRSQRCTTRSSPTPRSRDATRRTPGSCAQSLRSSPRHDRPDFDTRSSRRPTPGSSYTCTPMRAPHPARWNSCPRFRPRTATRLAC
jgi:hypothetical protein